MPDPIDWLLRGRFINAPLEGGTEQQKEIPSMAASALDSPDAEHSSHSRQGERGNAMDDFREGRDRRAGAETPRAFAALHRLIEEQAKRTPHADAVIWGDVTWSYRTLMARSAEVSAYLQAAQVGKGGLVAVLLPRTPDMMASLIGILRIGAAYLPLDPEAPAARVAACIEDAKPDAILTQGPMASVPSTEARVLLLEQLPAMSGEAFRESVACAMEDLAYVIYTSGTTGRPKGVEIMHGGVVNLLTSMQREPGFTSADKILALTTISFDMSVPELYLALVSGGSMVLVGREVAQDPWLAAQVIEQSACTVVQGTPAFWHSLLASGWRGTGHRLKVWCGAEPLPRELAQTLLELGMELWNLYGPTETTVWSTLCRIENADSISIGGPIANTTTWVLNEQHEPAPAGTAGHLWIGGTGLARGYRGRPDATAERFRCLDAAGGARLYNTGDRAIQRPDGRLQCLGRADNQVKVRGFRVELEAVEAAVCRHPQVAAAAARVWPDATGSNRLSAYVVGRDGQRPDPATLRSFLREDQPDYMIPSDVVVIDALPLSWNGKVDRSQLPCPPAPSAAPASAGGAGGTEEKLAAIWTELLHDSGFLGTDSFFDRGGHSLLMVQLHERIDRSFGVQIPIALLFQSPTLAQQVELIRASGREAAVMPLRTQGAMPPLFWIHPPPLIANLVEALGADQPVFGVGLSESDLAALGPEPSIEEIASPLEKKILASKPQGPFFLAGFCSGGLVTYEIATRLRTAGCEIPLVILLDTANPVCFRNFSVAVEMSKAWFYFRKVLHRSSHGKQESLTDLTARLFAHVKQVLTGGVTAAGEGGQEIIPGQWAMERAERRYDPPAYAGNVLLLQPADHAKRMNEYPGWKPLISGALLYRQVEGHHDTIFDREQVSILAELIAAALQDVGRLAHQGNVLAHKNTGRAENQAQLQKRSA